MPNTVFNCDCSFYTAHSFGSLISLNNQWNIDVSGLELICHDVLLNRPKQMVLKVLPPLKGQVSPYTGLHFRFWKIKFSTFCRITYGFNIFLTS
jgi:hypothetical protein